VNAETAPTTEFATFAQTATGVAFANPSTTQSATITFTVYSATGTSLGSQSVTLGPLAHSSANVGPLLGLQSFTGFVKIASSIPIISLSLNAEAFPVFSSLPPGDLPSSTPLVKPLTGIRYCSHRGCELQATFSVTRNVPTDAQRGVCSNMQAGIRASQIRTKKMTVLSAVPRRSYSEYWPAYSAISVLFFLRSFVRVARIPPQADTSVNAARTRQESSIDALQNPRSMTRKARSFYVAHDEVFDGRATFNDVQAYLLSDCLQQRTLISAPPFEAKIPESGGKRIARRDHRVQLALKPTAKIFKRYTARVYGAVDVENGGSLAAQLATFEGF
jgi:hypothetical protein